MPSENWGKQGTWPPGSENKIVKEDDLRSKLESMNMKGLRNYVKLHGLKAKDTDRSELIEEILEEVK